MIDQLSSLGSRLGDAQPVDHIIEAQLQHLQQVLAGCARAAVGFGKHALELTLEDAVALAYLLLFLEPVSIVGDLAPTRRSLAGRLIAPVNRALRANATFALEHQLFAGASADSADGSGVSSHWRFSLSVVVVGCGCPGWAGG